MAIRVFLVEDDELLRSSWQKTLPHSGEIQVVGAAADAAQALQLFDQVEADVAVIDLKLPQGDGVTVIRQLAARAPSLRLLAISGDPSPPRLRQAIAAGASGFVAKGGGYRELRQAIFRVLDGKSYFSPELMPAECQDYVDLQRETPGHRRLLSDNEQRVLRGIARGLTSCELAAELYLSRRTVERCRASLKNRLCVESTAELVQQAIRLGLTTA